MHHVMYRHPATQWSKNGCRLTTSCNKCGILDTHITHKHHASRLCKIGTAMRQRATLKRKRDAAQGQQFFIGGTPLQQVPEYTYLGRIITETDEDSTTICHNLIKARKLWYNIQSILRNKNTTIPIATAIFRTLIESVLLYAAETWSPTKQQLKETRSFQYHCLLRISGIKYWTTDPADPKKKIFGWPK